MLADVDRQAAISGVLPAGRYVPKPAEFNAAIALYFVAMSREGRCDANDGSEC